MTKLMYYRDSEQEQNAICFILIGPREMTAEVLLEVIAHHNQRLTMARKNMMRYARPVTASNLP